MKFQIGKRFFNIQNYTFSIAYGNATTFMKAFSIVIYIHFHFTVQDESLMNNFS